MDDELFRRYQPSLKSAQSWAGALSLLFLLGGGFWLFGAIAAYTFHFESSGGLLHIELISTVLFFAVGILLGRVSFCARRVLKGGVDRDAALGVYLRSVALFFMVPGALALLCLFATLGRGIYQCLNL